MCTRSTQTGFPVLNNLQTGFKTRQKQNKKQKKPKSDFIYNQIFFICTVMKAFRKLFRCRELGFFFQVSDVTYAVLNFF